MIFLRMSSATETEYLPTPFALTPVFLSHLANIHRLGLGWISERQQAHSASGVRLSRNTRVEPASGKVSRRIVVYYNITIYMHFALLIECRKWCVHSNAIYYIIKSNGWKY